MSTPRILIIAHNRNLWGDSRWKWRGFGFYRLPKAKEWRLRLGFWTIGFGIVEDEQ